MKFCNNEDNLNCCIDIQSDCGKNIRDVKYESHEFLEILKLVQLLIDF